MELLLNQGANKAKQATIEQKGLYKYLFLLYNYLS
jgi:hypothetical protein